MLLSRAPCSTRSTMAPSSSSARRPSEFWLSPSRSKTAQAMPCRSIEKRQSRSAFMSVMYTPTLFCRGALHGPRIVARCHVVRPHLGRIEVIDGDDARGQRFHLAQQAASSSVMTPSLAASPIQSVPCTRRTWPARTARSSFFSATSAATALANVTSSRPVGSLGFCRDVDEAGQAVAHLARRQHQLNALVAEPIGRRLVVGAEREHHRPHQPAHRRDGEVVDRAAQRLLEAEQAVLRGEAPRCGGRWPACRRPRSA